MDPTENLARQHLLSRGYTDPVYEPDGQVPPDFLIEGRIAIEVRRLNQNERTGTHARGLEEVAIPIIEGIQSLARSFGPASSNAWWLELDFRRPVAGWPRLRPGVHEFLQRVRETASQAPASAQIHDNLKVTALPRSGQLDDMFHLAIVHDDDTGGWLLDELEHNLRLCIQEKTAKAKPYRDRYPEWWLILVDHVTYGRKERTPLPFSILHDWDRVVLVNPLAPQTHYEL